MSLIYKSIKTQTLTQQKKIFPQKNFIEFADKMKTTERNISDKIIKSANFYTT